MSWRDWLPWQRKATNSLELFREIYGSKATKAGATVGLKEAIRCATVDNFQGEEAKVIILSLTRNNSQGNIGGC